MQTLEMMIRAIRAVNTMGGRQSAIIIVSCEFDDILTVKQSFNHCGITKHEVGVIHCSDVKQGMIRFMQGVKYNQKQYLLQLKLGAFCTWTQD